MMRSRCLQLAISLAILLAASMAFADSKQQLESRFRQKLFYIRGFYRDSKLVYDAQGNVLGQPQKGPWTLGLIRIEGTQVYGDKFVLEGHRAAAVYDGARKQFLNVYPKKSESVAITVRASPDSLTDSDMNALANRIFEERLKLDDVPETWRDFFSGKLAMSKDYPEGSPIPGLDSGGQPVYRSAPTHGVTPPRLLSKSEPKYVEIARQARIEGTSVLNLIVNRQGQPEHIEIAKPLGIGLDDSAVESVSSWRFAPAMMNGQPIAVLISVEVAFRLY